MAKIGSNRLKLKGLILLVKPVFGHKARLKTKNSCSRFMVYLAVREQLKYIRKYNLLN
jgi:hypothetical protein